VLLSALTSPVVTDWWAVVLDGVIGAVVGGTFTSFVALSLARRSKEDQRELAREQAALAAAENVALVLMETSTAIAGLIGYYDDRSFGKRLAAVQRFDSDADLKSFALVSHAPPPASNVRSDSRCSFGVPRESTELGQTI
jgi:hypothetical protein